jgi:hypothetical protein
MTTAHLKPVKEQVVALMGASSGIDLYTDTTRPRTASGHSREASTMAADAPDAEARGRGRHSASTLECLAKRDIESARGAFSRKVWKYSHS